MHCSGSCSKAANLFLERNGSASKNQHPSPGHATRTTPILSSVTRRVCGATFSRAKIGEREFTGAILRFHYNRVQVDSETFELDQLDEISGTANEIEIPREAMGRGDLKFLACIGAFLGWRAVLFAIFAGSLYGSIIGLITLALGRRVWSLKLPFGPYLALGAITWMFFGDAVVRWYQTLLRP